MPDTQVGREEFDDFRKEVREDVKGIGLDVKGISITVQGLQLSVQKLSDQNSAIFWKLIATNILSLAVGTGVGTILHLVLVK